MQPTSALPSIPWQADEATYLVAFLDFYRAVVRRKAEGLDAEQLAYQHSPTTMSIGGLLKHMVIVEKWWFEAVWLGDDEVEAWFRRTFADDDDWEWKSAAQDSAEELFAGYDAAVSRAQEIVSAALTQSSGFDGLAQREAHGGTSNLRWLMIHMIEEYARHAGHADLIREAIDGVTGD